MTPDTDAAGPALDAARLIGLLAEVDRRRVVAALQLGASSFQEVAHAAGLDERRAASALGTLVDAGLVVHVEAGGLALVESAFSVAARAALARPRRSEHADEPDDVRRVLDAFVRDDQLTEIPASRQKRLVVLDWLVQAFEPGIRYDERHVNEVIAARHPDTAALRRYLVDEGFMDRADGWYWRAGGTVAPERS
jgi:hypothetical protein